MGPVLDPAPCKRLHWRRYSQSGLWGVASVDSMTSGPRRGIGPRRGATVKDVAREAGVSIASVSRVINGNDRVADETRRRVDEAIRRLKYIPHYGAASLVTRRNNLVGLMLPELHGEFFSELVCGIEEAARRHDLHILILNTTGDDESDARAISELRGKVGGLLLMASHLRQELLLEHLPGDLPSVGMNTLLDSHGSMLMIDNYGASMTAMQHLAACGRQRVAHIAGPERNFDAEERVRGYLDGLSVHFPGASPLIVQGDFLQQSGFDAGRCIAALPERPDAVFAANDTMAVGASRAMREAGIAIPRDVALIGFDDIPLAALVCPALTTMRIDIAGFGRRALERLVRIFEEPEMSHGRMEPVCPTLVIRESCGGGLSALPNLALTSA